jgi:hypothetical protein
MRNSECVMRNDEAARGGEVWPAAMGRGCFAAGKCSFRLREAWPQAMGSALLRGMGWVTAYTESTEAQRRRLKPAFSQRFFYKWDVLCILPDSLRPLWRDGGFGDGCFTAVYTEGALGLRWRLEEPREVAVTQPGSALRRGRRGTGEREQMRNSECVMRNDEAARGGEQPRHR